ncbi:MAG: hypothetical protein EAZ62_08575 [Sphingobacteriia bacterium]|nr:MAG: hypothetical protein EAZ62_08575 [Sphingobacteriia bacterium]
MVKARTLDKIGEDQRGATHYFDTARSGQFIVAYRKAGSVSGRHYHKGLSPLKNPEQLVLMQGSGVFRWKDVRNGQTGEVLVQAPAFIEIEPWAWHELVATTDLVMFELNGLTDAKDDTFHLD